MNLKPLVDIISDNGLGIQGKTLFLHIMPSDVEVGITLRDQTIGTQIDHELPQYRKSKYQAIVRCVDYEAGEALINSVVEVLTFNELIVDGMKFKFSRPRHEPVAYALSISNKLEFSVNFDAVYVIVP